MFMFQAETSFMTFEGMQLQGAMKIMEKLNVSMTGRLLCGVHLAFLSYRVTWVNPLQA